MSLTTNIYLTQQDTAQMRIPEEMWAGAGSRSRASDTGQPIGSETGIAVFGILTTSVTPTPTAYLPHQSQDTI